MIFMTIECSGSLFLPSGYVIWGQWMLEAEHKSNTDLIQLALHKPSQNTE